MTINNQDIKIKELWVVIANNNINKESSHRYNRT
jgi:hypothetical protein